MTGQSLVATHYQNHANGPYAELADTKEFAMDRFLRSVSTRLLSWVHRFDSTPRRFADQVEGLAGSYAGLSESALQTQIGIVTKKLRRHGLQQQQVAESFALIREVATRVIGQRHYPVQILGGYALIRGHIAEMATGEGKTLTATLAAATAALGGIPVHIVTVNDYLAARDAEEMGPLYRALGLSVGVIQNGLSSDEKRAAYLSDITYCTNKELGFDYLRDRLLLKDWPSVGCLQLRRLLGLGDTGSGLMLRGLHFAIIDEADSVLIDEARTPLIISDQGKDFYDMNRLNDAIAFAKRLRHRVDFDLFPKERVARLKLIGLNRIREHQAENGNEKTLEPVWVDLVSQTLAALYLYHRDQHYLVKDGAVQIIDEYTGRLMPDRTWEYGLHQIIEAKENCAISPQRKTLARITYQRFFRRYLHLAGMTGTGKEVAPELWAVYRLKSSMIPPHRPSQRVYYPPRLFRTQAEKWQAVVESAQYEALERGRPVLIGTRSVEASERLSGLLTAAGLCHQVLNARQDAEEACLVAAAGQAGCLTVATNMAGRGTDIKLGHGVAGQGGLHIILTEFSEAGRIDRQFYGRAGRQGDPGSAEAIVALDDELFQTYVPAWFRFFFKQQNATPWLIYVCRYLAQSRAERLHAAMRDQTLKSDREIEQLLAFAGKAL